jgi:hypothetical protein
VWKVIQPGDPRAASFNDDSSPDTRLTSGQKISVNAQVVAEAPFDWYYRILQLCESIQGELKSAEVWPRFQAIHGENKERIWAGLSKVRIHIVDPRPYRSTLDNTVREIFRCNDPATFLRQQVALKEPRAVFVSQQVQLFTAERILSDSVASRVHQVSKFLNDEPLFARPPEGPEQDEVLQLSDLGQELKPIVRKVSTWAAKSAATFHEALDCFLELDEEIRYSPSQFIRKRMAARVLKTHTFDKGDRQQIELLENARDSILQKLRGFDIPGGTAKREPYLQSDSKDSYLVQAADIAAGIASKILETQSLVAVVSSFEYVTYNGRRMSVTDAEEEVRQTHR